jgi:hypothetical protein
LFLVMMTAARSERSDHRKPRSDKFLLEQLRDRAPGKEEHSRDSGSEKTIFHIKRDGRSVDYIHYGTRGCEFLAVPENSLQGIHEERFSVPLAAKRCTRCEPSDERGWHHRILWQFLGKVFRDIFELHGIL